MIDRLRYSEKIKNKSIYTIVMMNIICFKIQLIFIAIWQAIGTLYQKTEECWTLSWANIIQFILNGLPFAVGGASIVLILLQYVLIGIFVMNLFVLIMIRSDTQKSKQHQQQSLKK